MKDQDKKELNNNDLDNIAGGYTSTDILFDDAVYAYDRVTLRNTDNMTDHKPLMNDSKRPDTRLKAGPP